MDPAGFQRSQLKLLLEIDLQIAAGGSGDSFICYLSPRFLGGRGGGELYTSCHRQIVYVCFATLGT